MTREQHRRRHKLLHQLFDELCADYLCHHRGAMPRTTNMHMLMEWSAQQSQNPDEVNEVVHSTYVCAHCGETVENPDHHTCKLEAPNDPLPGRAHND